MASFKAKIVWKMSRKRENKNYLFVMFAPDAVQKIAKKGKKKKKIPLWHHFKPNSLDKAKKERK